MGGGDESFAESYQMKFPQSRIALISWHRHYLLLAKESRSTGDRESAAHLQMMAATTRRHIVTLHTKAAA